MSSLIYLITMAAVGWLVLWTIRDPKERKWDWWPIEWWPFDTDAEAQIERTTAEAQQTAGASMRSQATPWRDRSAQLRQAARPGIPRRRR